MSKMNVLVYYDLTGGSDETIESVKEKAAFLRGRLGNRAVMLRDAIRFDEVEPRVALTVLLGGTATAALASVYQAYEAVGVPLSSYDELVRGEGPQLTDDDEDAETPAAYLGRLKAQATERGITFTDATTSDELEMLIRHYDEDKRAADEAELIRFERLSAEAVELGVAFDESFTNDQLEADIEAARAAKAEAEDALRQLRQQAEAMGIPTDDGMTHEQVEALISEKSAETGDDGGDSSFDVETATFEELKTKAEELELAFPSNIGEATLRKKVADHLNKETGDEE